MNKDGWNHKPSEWEKEPLNLIKEIETVGKKSLNLPVTNKIYDYDVIFVLAGGLTDNGNVHEWVLRRLNKAFEIYKMNINPVKIVCLGGGTYHKPPILNNNRYVVHESTACAQYLITLGVDCKDVYREWSSYDTIANGYFAITNYIIPFQFVKPIVVTSEFHMLRTSTIFNWLFKLANLSTPVFCPVNDDGIDSKIIKCRIEREIKSLFNLETFVIPKIKNFKQFATWFYEDHKAYCSSLNIEPEIDSDTLKSY